MRVYLIRRVSNLKKLNSPLHLNIYNSFITCVMAQNTYSLLYMLVDLVLSDIVVYSTRDNIVELLLKKSQIHTKFLTFCINTQSHYQRYIV